MSKRGRECAEVMCDWLQLNAPSVSKAYGGRAELVQSLSVPGEFLAAVIAEKQKAAKANSKLLAQYKRMDALQEKVLTNLKRAQDIDALTLPRAEAYASGGSRLVPFEPDEYQITRKTQNMIQRHMHGTNGYNGHEQELRAHEERETEAC